MRATNEFDEACILAIEVCLNLSHMWPQLLNYPIDPLNLEHGLPQQANC
jgi:hypothetical protein